MKLSLPLSFVSLANIIISVQSDTVKCKVVPFETKDGISGTCCVFFRNDSAPLPHEEIKQQIAARKKTDDAVVFRDEERKEKKESTETKKNVTIANKNAFDAPSGCPPGKMKDHTGACTEPF